MRILSTCLVLLSVCALGTPTFAAPGEQQKPPTTPRPPAPPPTTPNPAPVPVPPGPPTARRPAPARPAARRAPLSRGLLTASGLLQPTTASFTDARDIPYFRELATRTGEYDVDGGPGVDAGVFARLWRGLGLGVSVSRVSRSGEVAFSGRYPHPFFFGQTRAAEIAATDADRTETGVHVSAAYLLSSPQRFRLVVYGGPTFYRVSQDVFEDVTVNEAYPYDAITLASGARSELSTSLAGFHGGADAAWYFTRRVGLGALVRYGAASKSVTIGNGQSFDLEAGGFQAGLGLRVRF